MTMGLHPRVGLSTSELERFVAELAAEPDRWRHLANHASDERTYERIWDDEHVNAWVICWSEDHDTGFQDHDESRAAIAVVSGRVREERLRIGSSPPSRLLGPGTIFTVEPVAIHRVLHAGWEPAVTRHAYPPPLQRTGSYQIGPDRQLERTSLPCEQELRAQAT